MNYRVFSAVLMLGLALSPVAAMAADATAGAATVESATPAKAPDLKAPTKKAEVAPKPREVKRMKGGKMYHYRPAPHRHMVKKGKEMKKEVRRVAHAPLMKRKGMESSKSAAMKAPATTTASN